MMIAGPGEGAAQESRLIHIKWRQIKYVQ